MTDGSPLGLLYDIHGNLLALEAVLADAESAGVRDFLLGGDLTLFGPWPAETLTRLRALDQAAWIRGNGERWTADPGDAPEPVRDAIAACAAALGDAAVAELAALPDQTVLGGRRFCHGSPVSDVISFLPEPSVEERDWIGDATEPTLVFGHTHLPFQRAALGGQPWLVNPGSVGMPFDGDTRAAWAILRGDGSFEHRRATYDHGATAAAVRDRHPGFGATIARRIETASLVV
jgi:diadenosine tetraphosphatase ApaH/serine/threonine PP2A family protein phosphatase